MKRYLLIGCGYSRERRIDPLAGKVAPRTDWSDGELFTLDANPACKPDFVADLDSYERWPLEMVRMYQAYDLIDPDAGTIRDDTFDEVHAYEVLEHLGRQGDVESFFASFEPIWHVLKTGGYLCGTVPSLHSPWAWGDPGHRRILTAGTLAFLDRTHPVAPPSSDYRALNLCDFRLDSSYDDGERLSFVLQAVKPAREVPA